MGSQRLPSYAMVLVLQTFAEPIKQHSAVVDLVTAAEAADAAVNVKQRQDPCTDTLDAPWLT